MNAAANEPECKRCSKDVRGTGASGAALTQRESQRVKGGIRQRRGLLTLAPCLPPRRPCPHLPLPAVRSRSSDGAGLHRCLLLIKGPNRSACLLIYLAIQNFTRRPSLLTLCLCKFPSIITCKTCTNHIPKSDLLSTYARYYGFYVTLYGHFSPDTSHE